MAEGRIAYSDRMCMQKRLTWLIWAPAAVSKAKLGVALIKPEQPPSDIDFPDGLHLLIRSEPRASQFTTSGRYEARTSILGIMLNDLHAEIQALHLQQLATSPGALPPRDLCCNGPSALLSAVYTSAVEPSADPRAQSTHDSALPPGLSLGSMAGEPKTGERAGSGARGAGGSEGAPARRPSLRPSVDGAAGAELLHTLDLMQCCILPAKAGQEQVIGAVTVADSGMASGGQQAASTTAALLLQFPRPSPAAVQLLPPLEVTSQSQVPLQVEWSFDSDLQRARVQARCAAIDALDDIRYEVPDKVDGHHISNRSCGPARYRASSGFRYSGGACADTRAITTHAGRSGDNCKGLPWRLLSALRRETLCATSTSFPDEQEQCRGAVRGAVGGCSGRRNVRYIGTKGGTRRREQGHKRGCINFLRAIQHNAGKDECEVEEGEDEEEEGYLLVLLSRDSRLLHRVRMAVDITGRPTAKDAGSVAAGYLNAVETFGTTTAAERSAKSWAPALQFGAVTTSQLGPGVAAAEGRRVRFRCPLVERTHWVARSRDNLNAGNVGDDVFVDATGSTSALFAWDFGGAGAAAASSQPCGNTARHLRQLRFPSLTAALRRGVALTSGSWARSYSRPPLRGYY
ncbi:hypothetical protein VOLCADRAFT_96147 [Volvox carteri f. nagariensis]|uniref:Uncharacterized protein n=1 Tax=Volvox carteri f. nagariensis TaxID=3068 RepID=D8U9C0_VOLCA|nr:uncharacterized protein VOLCADRAFT_96147 [Volvox carteri f. nagariensis]EFJ43729.1 hypothetical protein VOLCADRAFT_96147 [Volvox carteri f. nagariensis]|eukprot:XP_002955210.1 hypothetical protein VOLCADRAFT_96147 [Volvox carteri f. nagariensis]